MITMLMDEDGGNGRLSCSSPINISGMKGMYGHTSQKYACLSIGCMFKDVFLSLMITSTDTEAYHTTTVIK